MTKTQADWVTIKEAENQGLMASMVAKHQHFQPQTHTQALSHYFREQHPHYLPYVKEEKVDDAIYELNTYIEENKINIHPFDFPMTGGLERRLLPLTEHLSLKIGLIDDYYGGGDYAQYVTLDSFVVDDETTTDDVDKLITFVVDFFNRVSDY